MPNFSPLNKYRALKASGLATALSMGLIGSTGLTDAIRLELAGQSNGIDGVLYFLLIAGANIVVALTVTTPENDMEPSGKTSYELVSNG